MLDAKGTDFIQAVQYYDGLGYPTLSVATAGVNGETAYSLTTYDAVGHKNREYVPVPGTNLDYINESSINSKGDFYMDNSGFTQNHYDALNRVTAVDIAGEKWRGAGKQNKTEYLANIASDYVLHYEAPEDGSYSLRHPENTSYQYYPEGILNKVVSYDADNKSVTVFTDLHGNKILERTAAGDTYYVYNVLGQLRFVLSPSYQSSHNEAIFAYEYRYDDRGRMVKKILPQCGTTQYWYDMADHVAYMRDPALGSRYRFYLYDNLGRLCVQGTCIDGNRDYSILSATTYVSGSDGICNSGYTIPYTINDPKLEIVNYYDNYDFIGKNLISTMPTVTINQNQEQYAIGSQTGLVVYATNGEALGSIDVYDYKGQVVRSVRKGINGFIEDVNTEYTFTGAIDNTVANVNVGYGSDFIAKTDYTYKCGKKMKMNLSLSHGITVLPRETEYLYDAIGRLSSKSRQLTTTGKSDCSYSYDVHGWLTGINSNGFRENLYYSDGLDGGCYNGNISTMKWKASNDGGYNGYNLKYDDSNRLYNAVYGSGDNLSNNKNYFDEHVEYDCNGNITGLKRSGLVDKIHGSFGMVDNLYMTYGGNRLTSVRDNATQLTYEGATDFNGEPNKEYPLTYNDAGSLISDAGRKIAKIDYDYLNNPVRIQFTDGNVTKYIYSATGEKLRVIYQTAVPNIAVAIGDTKELAPSEIQCTDYNDYLLGGNLTLKNGHIDKYQFEEGYCQAEKNSSNASIDDFTFYYYDKDHLGNIRQVTKADGSQTGNVVQTINYYPFGMQFCDGTTCNIDQKHKYNGKEFDNMHGLNTYDYGARQYNPATARWDRMDPLCEKYYSISPYAYCCNNPVAYYDVAGLDSVYYNESGIEIQRRNCANSLNFVIKTSQSTAELYKDSNPDQKGVSNPISKENAISTEEEIRKGNLAGDHMKNVTQFGSNSEMSAMISSIEDDGTGGVSDQNNREYSGKFTDTGVKDVKKSSVGDLSKNDNLVSYGNSDWHSHPSGSKTYKPGYSRTWQQAPSKQDLKTANHAEFVVGCGNKTIYKYNKYGIISTCPSSVFSK
ncbi:hypothetical protein prwr041_07320 [Prevotella herbatica]|uniref:DUF6443 domain-containing protein n=2 Tax=Prevotella herbatica TaxID=2801997 RepID=A0ABN6EHI4_9BACT|nr:hypothetical protein prwr041_07320 [Prevotella herbatica]